MTCDVEFARANVQKLRSLPIPAPSECGGRSMPQRQSTRTHEGAWALEVLETGLVLRRSKFPQWSQPIARWAYHGNLECPSAGPGSGPWDAQAPSWVRVVSNLFRHAGLEAASEITRVLKPKLVPDLRNPCGCIEYTSDTHESQVLGAPVSF